MFTNLKDSFLWFLFTGIILIGCSPKEKFERVLYFDQNFVNSKTSELVCNLSEDSILLNDILDFTILNDTSFVVVDGLGAYLYHISGTLKEQLGNSGQAGGEMLRPSCVYATSDLVYVWCSSLMKFLIFDHKGNLKKELSGFKRAVQKFVVNSSNEILYVYTSGFLNKSESKTVDVIDVYNIADKSSKKYGERGKEDEVLFTFRNSGGLYIETNTDQLIYLHPGNLIIHDLDLDSENTVRYKIDDKAFHTTKITSRTRDVVQNMPKLINYLSKNSLVKDLFKHNDQFIIVAEIGQYDFDEQGRITNTQKRKVKLYILDSSFNPNRTVLFDYPSSFTNIVIYSNAMYFLSLDFDGKDQLITLNRFSLYE